MGKKKSDDIFYGLILNEDQEKFKEAIMSGENQVIMVNAVAGAGKTLLAVACARLLCEHNGFDGALYVFPTVSEGILGFRPGDTQMKELDYLEPLYSALIKMNEDPERSIANTVSKKNGTAWIEARSATFMRGINLDNKVVIIDECQNMTVPIIKKIISRCHDNCRVIVCGCTAQTDISLSQSGFSRLIDYLKEFDKVEVCELPISYRGWLAAAIDKL